MTKQITVGYDGSVPSSEAVLWAAAEANSRAARLRIVSCFEIPSAGETFGGWAATEAYASIMEGTRSALAEIQTAVIWNVVNWSDVANRFDGARSLVSSDR